MASATAAMEAMSGRPRLKGFYYFYYYYYSLLLLLLVSRFYVGRRYPNYHGDRLENPKKKPWFIQISIWEFPKMRGTLFWGPYKKDPTM